MPPELFETTQNLGHSQKAERIKVYHEAGHVWEAE